MLTLETLLKKLNKTELQIHGSSENSISYNCANTISPAYPLQCNILYICPVSKLDRAYFNNHNIGLILIPDAPLEENCSISCEWVLWDENIPFDKLFNMVQNEFSKDIDYTSNISLIFSALMKGKGLRELIGIGTKILGNPIILTDASYKVIAMSNTDAAVNDPVWQFAQEHGYCGPDSIAKFRYEGVTARTLESEGPFILNSGLARDIPRILQKIIIDNEVVGYIGVLKVNQEFEQSHLDIVNVLCGIIAVEMKNEVPQYTFTNIIYESLLLDLLNNKIHGTGILRQRLKSAEWSLKPVLCVVVVPLSNNDESLLYSQYFYSQLRESTRLAKTVRYSRSIAMVVNCEKEDECNQALASIGQILTQNGLKAGVSRIFHSLEDLKTNYNQAYKACEIGRLIDEKKSSMYYYDEIMPYHIISQFEDEDELRNICVPSYYKLLEYDRQNDTDYCKTLYQYIICGNSVSASAAKLFIHRNTMSYRLEKISEITGCDLTNGEEVFRLYLSIKINYWLNINKM